MRSKMWIPKNNNWKNKRNWISKLTRMTLNNYSIVTLSEKELKWNYLVLTQTQRISLIIFWSIKNIDLLILISIGLSEQ